MAENRNVSVELSDLLQDLDLAALSGPLVCAPLAYKAARLARMAREQMPVLGVVKPPELVSALLHRAQAEGIGQTVATYREAHVWEARQGIGEDTSREGVWLVEVPGRGQRY